MKAAVGKLDINDLNDLKTKVDDLDVGKSKTVPIDLKRLSDVVSKEVMKKTVYNKLNTKVNSLNKKFLMHHLL